MAEKKKKVLVVGDPSIESIARGFSGIAVKPVPPIPQEPKCPFRESPDREIWSDCAAAYRPLLEQANRKIKGLESDVKQLEIKNGGLSNRNIQLEAENARLKEQIKEVAKRMIKGDLTRKLIALESQLKPVSGDVPIGTQQESGLSDQEIMDGVIPYTLRSVNGISRALVEFGWRKALASSKGEGK